MEGGWHRSLAAGGAVVAALTLVAPAVGSVVGGGGSASSDCLAVFDAAVNTPKSKPRHVKCTDGDPACDSDGTVNGACVIPVALCANSTALSKCTLNGVESITVDHALDNGDKKFDPQFQALQGQIDNGIQPPTDEADACTTATNFRVTIKGPVGKNHCRSNTKTVKVTTLSKLIDGKIYKDKDTIKLTCIPDPTTGCDPLTLFTGTFDRIQQQIFAQSCALSSCHDSQSKQGDLLLESGAAYGNLIGVVPNNLSAAGAGWKRVDVLSPTTGNAETSFLYHKVTGDLPDVSYGQSMPRSKPKLDKSLREVIRLWIESGAPDTGWVPGTF
jgi:hypothetical protein